MALQRRVWHWFPTQRRVASDMDSLRLAQRHHFILRQIASFISQQVARGGKTGWAYVCNSIWFTAGTILAVRSNCSILAAEKLDNPT